MRIYRSNLDKAMDTINTLLKTPLTAYNKPTVGERYVANIGNWHLDAANGGYTASVMNNESGGTTNPLSCGYLPAKELFAMLCGVVVGIEAAIKANGQT